MGLLDRIMLAVYTVSLGVFALIFLLMSLGWQIPLDFVGTSLRDSQGRLVAGLVSALYLVVSVRLVYYAFRRKYSGQTVVHETALGEIRVSLDAVENLVRRVARQIQGVRDVASHVSLTPAGIRVWAKIVVSPDVSIPAVSNDVQSSIKSYVRNVVGVEVAEISVYVENITAEMRRSRVE